MKNLVVRGCKLFTLFIACFGSAMYSYSCNSYEQSNNVNTAPKALTMFIWSNQLAPIISHSSENNVQGPISDYKGIIVDILARLPAHQQPKIKVKLSSRKRGERDLYNGVVDMTIIAKDWLNNPEKLIFSLPVYTHREFLYATRPIPNKALEALISNKRICGRRAYKFPKIEPFFENAKAIRINNQEEVTLFEMLMRKRCDFVITNEYVANAIIKSHHWQNDIYQTNVAINEVGFTMSFHPKHQAFVEQLNTHIRKLEQSGELALILKQTGAEP